MESVALEAFSEVKSSQLILPTRAVMIPVSRNHRGKTTSQSRQKENFVPVSLRGARTLICKARRFVGGEGGGGGEGVSGNVGGEFIMMGNII